MSAPPQSAPPTVLSRVLPAERLLFAGDVVCAGTFACGVDDPLFEGGEPSTAHCIVFSQTPVWIQHDGGRRYVADPTRVTFHNRGRAYRRWQIDARGDRCRWIAFAEDVALAAIDRVDPDCVDRSPGAPFRFQFMTAPALVYLRQHRFFRALDSRDGASRLEVEETSLNLLHDVVSHAYREARRRSRATDAPRRFDAVQHVRRQIAEAPGDDHTLRPLAATVGMSPSQLCRWFRRACGETMTAYRLRLRLLGSLDEVCGGADLTTVAIAWGFASHSHFTAAFHHAFGVVPSALRVRGAARQRAAAAAISRNR